MSQSGWASSCDATEPRNDGFVRIHRHLALLQRRPTMVSLMVLPATVAALLDRRAQPGSVVAAQDVRARADHLPIQDPSSTAARCWSGGQLDMCECRLADLVEDREIVIRTGLSQPPAGQT